MAQMPTARRSALAPLPEVSVRSADPEEARIVGTRVYYPHRVVVQGDSARFAMRLSAASLGPLTVGWLGYETQVRIETEELGQYQVNVPTADTMRSECGNRDIVSSPRTAAVYRPDQPTAFEGWSTPAPMLALKIARHSLERQLEQLLDRPLRGPIDFRLDMDISGGRGAQWWAMVCSLAADIDDPQSLIRQPLIAAPFAYSIMSGLLMAGTHSHLEELTAPAMAVSAETVRRARQFIEDHAGEPLTVADIARGADVGVRGLQHGFHRSLGTTPMQYLRHVRLRHAHQDLRNADPSSTTVAQVAARWGFLNQGRFAAQYRELYGVQPAEIGAAVDDLTGVVGKTTTTVALDCGRITVSPEVVLYLFGTPGQDRFWSMWKELSIGALGAVVLADTRRLGDCFGAVDFFESRSSPFIVAVNCFDGADIYEEDEVRQALDIGAHVPVQHCDARDRGSSKQVLVRLMEHLLATATSGDRYR